MSGDTMVKRAIIPLISFLILIAGTQASVACACCGTWRVSGLSPGDVLNVRTGPSVRYRKVGSLLNGSGCIVKTGKCIRRWCPIYDNLETRGWVHTRYLSLIK